MDWNFMFFMNSILLGVGLAMDAFSVSMANGLNEPKMSVSRMCLMAGCYGVFQFLMPMIGWICVHTIVHYFEKFQDFIPWIALILLLYIGGKMLIESIRDTVKAKKCGNCTNCECQNRKKVFKEKSDGKTVSECEEKDKKPEVKRLAFSALLIQGLATSIDALSVGFTIEQYGILQAIVASLIIAVVTFFICIGGLKIGKVVGTKLSTKAGFLGGVILIGIGIEIFVKGIFF